MLSSKLLCSVTLLLAGNNLVQAATKQFVWLTDIHADPYYGTKHQCCPTGKPPNITADNKWGTMGNDPGYDMLRSASVAAVEAARNPEFLLFSGDFTRHNQDQLWNPWENVTTIVKEVTAMMGEAFPTLLAAGRISLGTQGNDDAPQNYWFPFTANESSNPWASNLAAAFTETGAMNPREASNYSYGGAFAAEIGGLHIITLNTIIWSGMHKPRHASMGPDPFGQFAWLRSQLEAAKARGKPAWIVGHIPPGLETYTYTELWKAEYTAAYLSVVQDPDLGPWVAAQLFGHVHACEFRLLPAPSGNTGPVLLSGALSPIYLNNPAFRIVEYDDATSRPVGLAVHYATLTPGAESLEWKLGLNVTKDYAALGNAVARDGFLSQQAYADLAADLKKGGDDWNTYAMWYKGAYPNPQWDYGCATLASGGKEQDMAGVTKYLCAISIDTTVEQFRKCVDDTVPATCALQGDDSHFTDDNAPPAPAPAVVDDDKYENSVGVRTSAWIVLFVVAFIAIAVVTTLATKLGRNIKALERSSENGSEVLSPFHDDKDTQGSEYSPTRPTAGSADSNGSQTTGYSMVGGEGTDAVL